MAKSVYFLAIFYQVVEVCHHLSTADVNNIYQRVGEL